MGRKAHGAAMGEVGGELGEHACRQGVEHMDGRESGRKGRNGLREVKGRWGSTEGRGEKSMRMGKG